MSKIKNQLKSNYRFVKIQTIKRRSGLLGVVTDKNINFKIKRAYFLYQVPYLGKRGGHAHKTLKQVYICIQGKFVILLNDGFFKKKIILNSRSKGLVLFKNTWRDIISYSKNSILLDLASDKYKKEDYIRSYKSFLKYIKK
jgi:hypothetical protein